MRILGQLASAGVAAEDRLWLFRAFLKKALHGFAGFLRSAALD